MVTFDPNKIRVRGHKKNTWWYRVVKQIELL